VESKETKQRFALVVKEVAPSIEVPEKMKPMLKEFKRIIHAELPEGLSPMRDIQHHGAFILHGFEDPFMRKESVRDENFKFFKFISPYFSTWVQCVVRGIPSSISSCTLEDLHGGEPMKYGSIVYMYGRMMEEYQSIGIDY